MGDRLGFIGLGIMGAGMAHNLLPAGYKVTAYNRTMARVDPLVDSGASVAASPAELARQSDIIFCCVSDTPDVEEILFGAPDTTAPAPESVAAGVRPASLVVDMSTVNPGSTRVWATRLARQRVGFVDAPVSGGIEGAAGGSLSIMIRGPGPDIDRVQPYLREMGHTFTHVGEIGVGQTCKLVNQILLVGNMLAAAEALIFAKAGGLDLDQAITAVEGGAAGSWMLSNRGPQVVDRDWRPGFTIDLQKKDLRLVHETAAGCGVPTLTTDTIAGLYRSLQRDGLGSQGDRALVKALERLTGITVSRSFEPSSQTRDMAPASANQVDNSRYIS